MDDVLKLATTYAHLAADDQAGRNNQFLVLAQAYATVSIAQSLAIIAADVTRRAERQAESDAAGRVDPELGW